MPLVSPARRTLMLCIFHALFQISYGAETPESPDVLADWVPVTAANNIPKNFCYDDVAEQDDIDTISGSCTFLAFAAMVNESSMAYLTTKNLNASVATIPNLDAFLDGSSSMIGDLSLTSVFSSACLFRHSFVTSTGDIRLVTVNQDAVWHVNMGRRSIQLSRDANQATRFRMFKHMNHSLMLLRAGRHYVTLTSLHSSDSGLIIPQVTLSTSVTFGTILRSPRNMVKDSEATQLQITRKIDDLILSRRREVLLNSTSVSSETWMAYDLALAVLTRCQFNSFVLHDATIIELLEIFRKTFVLIVENLKSEHESIFHSLGNGFPRQFDVYSLATSQFFTVQTPILWKRLAAFFTSVYYTDQHDDAHHLGTAVFSAAKMRDFEENTSVFTIPADIVPNVMAVYYYSSCVLVWKTTSLTLLQKMDQVEIIYNRRQDRDGELQAGRPESMINYWFSALLKLPITSYNSSVVLLELGLMKALNANFLSVNSTIGDRLTKPIFGQLDSYLNAEQGVDLQGMYNMSQTPIVRELVNAFDTCCIPKQVKADFCVLPQIFRQIQVVSQFSREINNPNVITDIVTKSYVDLTEYLKLVQQDINYLEIGKALQKAKKDFTSMAYNLTSDLSSEIETSAISSVVESGNEVASSSEILSSYLQKGSAFRVKGLDIKLRQRLELIQNETSIVQANRQTFLNKLRSLLDGALAHIYADAFVNALYGIFQIYDLAGSLTPKISVDFGAVGVTIATLSEALHKSNDIHDTKELRTHMEVMLSDMNTTFIEMAQAFPILSRIQQSVESLTNKSANANLTGMQINAETFLNAVQGYTPLLTSAGIESLRGRFSSLTERLCQTVQTVTKMECVTISSDIELIFSSLGDILSLFDETMQLLRDFATETVNEHTLKTLDASIESNRLDAVSFKDVKNIWTVHPIIKQIWFSQWTRKQNYLIAAATAGCILNQVYIVSSLLQKCDNEAYASGGIPSRICQAYVYSGGPISDASISRLMASTPLPISVSTLTRTATIPTQPAFAGDSAYIDLAALLNNRNVTFQLPVNNATWLALHGWIQQESDLTTAVTYVKKLRLKLPVRFASYRSVPEGVTVTIRPIGPSMLGPAMQGKQFKIAPRTFVTQYTHIPVNSGRQDATCESVEYQNCEPNWPNYCFRKMGNVGENDAASALYPSLFTQWSVEASFDKMDDPAARIAYSKMASPMLLYVDYQVDRYAVPSSESPNLRQQPARSLQLPPRRRWRCCPMNYYMFISNMELSCVAWFGGLYCAIPNRPPQMGGNGMQAGANGMQMGGNGMQIGADRRYTH
uniref:AlNc14C91G5684 protein n=1 Tax=Albugo laibachii Nc14 TaxID=890382 RepID=F0WGF2_9STRA|nr:AlNc14C91G5684 [Albugo laibachii Nc14]|eukprot:CCA20313.1 AlNc14C91G5684 [Albugo laibachii Nc14]